MVFFSCRCLIKQLDKHSFLIIYPFFLFFLKNISFFDFCLLIFSIFQSSMVKIKTYYKKLINL